MKTAQKQRLMQKGFTLIELLVVIAIIAILAITVFVALDPVRRFQDARDSRRWADVNNLLTAVHEYIVDNDGSLPAGLSAGVNAELGTCGTCVDLSAPLTPYLKSIPVDPQEADADGGTDYGVDVDSNNMITVSAPNAENQTVQVSR